ncbi:zinc ribbon domain-containing protein [Haloarcula tradensis]|uniref:Zinc ribbon domain-containing protein n=2 Tax=Haloarcula argentinensis TaxID=43776 RepID=A0ABU2EV58_HALAR|nr:zinc ribbon domain-containing protein [Haloarcula argentinensis]
MTADPRCPHCSEKVSATATWCMHCGRDFDSPVDAGTGTTVLDAGGSQTTSDLEAALNAGDLDGIQNALAQSDNGPTIVGVVLAGIALFTLPLVSPPGAALYLLVVAGVGAIAATQSTFDAALRTGGKALALAPFVLVFIHVFLGYLSSEAVATSATVLVGPAIYAGLVMYGIRWYRRR